MKKRLLALLAILLMLASTADSRDPKSGNREELNWKSIAERVTRTSQQDSADGSQAQAAGAAERAEIDLTASGAPDEPARPMVPVAGEQILWQIISGGGGSSSSTSYLLGSVVGQTAAGRITSTNFILLQGFWQDFGPASCCIGTTGNVNKSVSETPDLSDLSLLIAFLTVTPKPTLPCLQEANVNGSVAQTPDLSDLSLLISFLTVTPKPVLPICS